MPSLQAIELQAQTFVERAPRVPARCVAEISGPTVPTFESRVRNISNSGMLIDQFGHMSVGDVVVARIPGVEELVGTIVRVRDGTAGVRFLTPFDLRRYRSNL